MVKSKEEGRYPEWQSGIPAWPDSQRGYYVYNLQQVDKNIYEGLMVFRLNYPANGQPEEPDTMYLAVQNLRVEKEKDRWVAIPLEDFRSVEALEESLEWGCGELPSVVYSGEVDDFQINMNVQTVYTVDSTYNTMPEPNTEFTMATISNSNGVMHLGSQEERDLIESVGISVAPVYSGEKRPTQLAEVGEYGSGGGSSDGEVWGSERTEIGWGPYIELAGSSGTIAPNAEIVFPKFYVADFYVNGELLQQLDLYPRKGAAE